MLRYMQTRLSALLDVSQEIFPRDERELRGLQRFSRYFELYRRDRRVQAQNVSWPRDFHDHRLSFAVRCQQFHASLADDVHTSRRLALHEDHRAFRIRTDVLDSVQGLQRWA